MKKATINFWQNVHLYIKKYWLCAGNQGSWERIVDGIYIRNHGIWNAQDNWNLIATTFSYWLLPVSIMLQRLNFPHKWTSRKYGISCWLHKFWIYSFIQFIVRPPALTEKHTKWENRNKNEKYDIEYENKKDWSFQPRLSFGWEAPMSDSNTITVHYHKQT